MHTNFVILRSDEHNPRITALYAVPIIVSGREMGSPDPDL